MSCHVGPLSLWLQSSIGTCTMPASNPKWISMSNCWPLIHHTLVLCQQNDWALITNVVSDVPNCRHLIRVPYHLTTGLWSDKNMPNCRHSIKVPYDQTTRHWSDSNMPNCRHLIRVLYHLTTRLWSDSNMPNCRCLRRVPYHLTTRLWSEVTGQTVGVWYNT